MENPKRRAPRNAHNALPLTCLPYLTKLKSRNLKRFAYISFPVLMHAASRVCVYQSSMLFVLLLSAISGTNIVPRVATGWLQCATLLCGSPD